MRYNNQGQIRGPFTANQDLYSLIQQDCGYTSPILIWHLGIQTEEGNNFIINNKYTTIGHTGVYEIGNAEIGMSERNKFKTLQDLDEHTIIDYVVIKK